jgi:hypothetical protein
MTEYYTAMKKKDDAPWELTWEALYEILASQTVTTIIAT